MAGLKQAAISAGLETLYFSGTHRLARPLLGGVGAILTFHHVRPPRADAFQPNRHLEISPGFLEEVIFALDAAGIDIVSIGEAYRRLVAGERGRRFVVLSFDDGYRDNLAFAWPLLDRYDVPFVMYVATAFADGQGELWWRVLEEAIACRDTITVTLLDGTRVFACDTLKAKEETYRALYRWLRRWPDEAVLRQLVRRIATDNDVDIAELCRRECMDWDDLAFLAGNQLVTIGAHTVDHMMLAHVPEDAAYDQIVDSAEQIQTRLGVKPRHFAYPVGDKDAAGQREFAMATDAGFLTAVTTRPGVLFAEHRNYLTALPRISVNGEFQRRRYLDVLLSGAATALWNGFRRVDAA